MTNRLAQATSPYLLQHADNPVDWWEWGPDAFEEARRRGVPVLLSVGYAACHWCHVMAHESFEDEATAAYLNEHFVSIKVDREERPDVDAVYMKATTAMTGHGGWPMTCVLDHDGNPWFAGTYFPDQPRHGQPSFTQVLQALSEAWRDKPEDVRRVAGNLREHLNQQAAPASGALDPRGARRRRRAARPGLRHGRGGFGGAPKFPPSMVLEFLSAAPVRAGRGRCSTRPARRWPAAGSTTSSAAASRATRSTPAGWCRTSRRCSTTTPSCSGSTPAGAARWGERVARETADFLIRELRTAEGGFASALDADSEGVEGKYYAWTPAAARGGARAGRRRVGGRRLRGHRRRDLRARGVHPAAAAATPRARGPGGSRRTTPADGRPRRAGPAGA